MRRSASLAAALVALACGLLVPGAALAGTIRGRVVLEVEGVRLADAGPVVVFLEGPGSTAPPRERRSIHQRNARFTPGFMAVTVGQQIDMPNDDAIYHNVFSFSKGNRFDLGLYPAGESRSVAFDEPGVVKIYCSIHESMSATVFVSPTPHYAVAAADGAFALEGVPPGRYRARTWSERLPEVEREVVVRADGITELTLGIGAPAAPAPVRAAPPRGARGRATGP